MKTRILAAVAATALLAGCAAPNIITGHDDRVKYTVVFEGAAQDHLQMVQVGSQKAGDLNKVSVELKNDSDFAFTCDYRFKWYDAGGMEINPEGGSWVPLTLSPQETKSVQSVAPNASGSTFKLMLEEHK